MNHSKKFLAMRRLEEMLDDAATDEEWDIYQRISDAYEYIEMVSDDKTIEDTVEYLEKIIKISKSREQVSQ